MIYKQTVRSPITFDGGTTTHPLDRAAETHPRRFGMFALQALEKTIFFFSSKFTSIVHVRHDKTIFDSHSQRGTSVYIIGKN